MRRGRVESNVGYIKKNLLAGLELPCGLEAMNHAAMNWLTATANVRQHNVTKRKPRDLFEEKERAGLISLPPHRPDTSVVHSIRSNSQFRMRFEPAGAAPLCRPIMFLSRNKPHRPPSAQL